MFSNKQRLRTSLDRLFFSLFFSPSSVLKIERTAHSGMPNKDSEKAEPLHSAACIFKYLIKEE